MEFEGGYLVIMTHIKADIIRELVSGSGGVKVETEVFLQTLGHYKPHILLSRHPMRREPLIFLLDVILM